MTAEPTKTELLLARAQAGHPGVPWGAVFADLQDDVRGVVHEYAQKCRGLDEEELTSYLLGVGAIALMYAYSIPDLWCEPGAYAGEAIRRKAGTYVHRMRTPASFTEWQIRKHNTRLAQLNQHYTLICEGEEGEDETKEEALGRVIARRGQALPEHRGPLECALDRVRELADACPYASRVLLGRERPAAVARDTGLESGQVRLAAARVRTTMAHDQVLQDLVRSLGVELARPLRASWTLACVAVASGQDLPVDWPEPPYYATPDEAWEAAERMEQAYYRRDPDAIIEVKFVARRTRGPEAP